MSKHVPPPTGEPLTRASTDLRLFAEAEVERLLAFLDALDGDPDLEPSMPGYSDGMDDREGDPADDEPSLGSVAGHAGYRAKNAGQCGWAQGRSR